MDSDKLPPEMDLHNLRAVRVLGRGSLGTVFLVDDTFGYHQPLALKVFDRSSDHHHAHRRAHHEIAVLRRLSTSRHPFLPHLIGSSENPDFICWAVPFCPGGDLNVLRHRQCDGVFSPAAVRFYLAEIVSALEHLHALGLVYRDLKPENILVQQSGHVTLTDFDLSRDLRPREVSSNHIHAPHEKPVTHKNNITTRNHAFRSKVNLKRAKSARISPVGRRNPGRDFSSGERANSFVGTDEYVAPEVVCGDGHEFAVDWWALGVLCYEMLYGTTPFRGRNRKETFQNILLADPTFAGKPDSLTDLMRRLLEKDPTRRLGFRGGASEIKGHAFFRGLRWDLVREISRPPFLPSEDDAAEEGSGHIDIWEYFERLRSPPSPLWSPSPDECRHSSWAAEF